MLWPAAVGMLHVAAVVGCRYLLAVMEKARFEVAGVYPAFEPHPNGRICLFGIGVVKLGVPVEVGIADRQVPVLIDIEIYKVLVTLVGVLGFEFDDLEFALKSDTVVAQVSDLNAKEATGD